jgi:hypothetical protein
MTDPINKALEIANNKIDELLSKRVEIDKGIVDWTRVRDSLLKVSQGESDDPSDVEVSVVNKPERTTIRFTEGVRMVLKQNASRDISVPEIRDQLINLGFDFAKYAQPLVPIHNTLKRLEEQGEVKTLKNEQGQTLGYRWISTLQRALAEPPNDFFTNVAAMYGGVGTASEDNNPYTAAYWEGKPKRKL